MTSAIISFTLLKRISLMLIVFSAAYSINSAINVPLHPRTFSRLTLYHAISILVMTGMWYTVVRTTITISSAHAVHTFKNSQFVSISAHDYNNLLSFLLFGLLRCMWISNSCGDKVIEKEWKCLYTTSWCNDIDCLSHWQMKIKFTNRTRKD